MQVAVLGPRAVLEEGQSLLVAHPDHRAPSDLIGQVVAVTGVAFAGGMLQLCRRYNLPCVWSKEAPQRGKKGGVGTPHKVTIVDYLRCGTTD